MGTSLFLGTLGPLQIGLIILAILLLFGGKKIPELMRGLGQGLNEFKKARGEDDTKKKDEKKEEEKK
jgi:sec-independent protein translocase protein TatA